MAIRFLNDLCILLAMNPEFQDGVQRSLKSVIILIKNYPDRTIAPTASRYIFWRGSQNCEYCLLAASRVSARMEELCSDRMDFHEI